jgi:KEOPS complex subunit Cgi121
METPLPQYEIRVARVTVHDTREFLNRLRRVMKSSGTVIVCFNAENMAGIRHADAALLHAIRSFYGGVPIAKTLEMEALLYAAGTRQCTEAGALGIHDGENLLYICCCPSREVGWKALADLMHFSEGPDDAVDPAHAGRLKHLYAITDEEIAAAGGESRLFDLVIERVALLDAYR